MTSPAVIEQGDEGPTVVALQLALTALGVYSGELSGAFDQSTKDSVTQLQSAAGISPSGVVDAQTWSILGNQSFGADEKSQLPVDEFPATARIAESDNDIDAYLTALGIDPEGLDDDGHST
jgi:peptidoglycan hydrolase-like protein with peptidoglycan-binding domain